MKYARDLKRMVRDVLAPFRLLSAADIRALQATPDFPQRIEDISKQSEDLIRETNGTEFARKAISETSLRNATTLARQVKAATGLEIAPVFAFGSAPKLDVSTPVVLTEEQILAAAIAENTALIKSLSEDGIARVAGFLLRGLRQGLRAEEIAKSIRESVKVTERRANLIARDQVSKVHGSLNRTRQVSLGVEKYIWRTSLDERVRDSHLQLEGRVFSFEGEPAPPEGHPGEPINCRCSAEPIFFEDEAPSGPTAEDRANVENVEEAREEGRPVTG